MSQATNVLIFFHQKRHFWECELRICDANMLQNLVGTILMLECLLLFLLHWIHRNDGSNQKEQHIAIYCIAIGVVCHLLLRTRRRIMFAQVH